LPFKKMFPPRPELAPAFVPRTPERANRDPPSFTDARVTLPELHRARIRCDRDTRDATRCSVWPFGEGREEKKRQGPPPWRSIYPKNRRSIRFSWVIFAIRHTKGLSTRMWARKIFEYLANRPMSFQQLGQPPQRIFDSIVVFPPHWLVVQF